MSAITVEFSPKYPLHLATDTESTRYALAGVQIEPCVLRDGGKPHNGIVCAATNGRILAVVRQEGECAETVIAPGDCFKANKGQEVNIAKNGRWEKSAWKMKRGQRTDMTTNVLSEVEGRFPRYRDILPNIEIGRTLSVSLDPRQLLDLATAIRRVDGDTHAVTLIIPVHHQQDADGDLPMAMEAACEGIACVVDGGGVGVLMPCAGDSRKGGDDESHKYARQQYVEFVKSLQPKKEGN